MHTLIAQRRSSLDEDQNGRVRLLTLHRSKGLEFRHVFLPAWEDGVFPPAYGLMEEERRLAYVAITRGMRRVTISHCAFRRGTTQPSPFLADIPARNRVTGLLRAPAISRADRLKGAAAVLADHR